MINDVGSFLNFLFRKIIVFDGLVENILTSPLRSSCLRRETRRDAREFAAARYIFFLSSLVVFFSWAVIPLLV